MIDETTGKADFRVLDMRRQILCIRNRQCGICGQLLGKFVAFIGGPQSGESHVFTDPGMHRQCAEFAASVCPFISRETAMYRDVNDTDRETLKRLGILVEDLEYVSDDREDPRMFIYITKEYTPVRVTNASVAAHADEFTETLQVEQTRSVWR